MLVLRASTGFARCMHSEKFPKRTKNEKNNWKNKWKCLASHECYSFDTFGLVMSPKIRSLLWMCIIKSRYNIYRTETPIICQNFHFSYHYSNAKRKWISKISLEIKPHDFRWIHTILIWASAHSTAQHSTIQHIAPIPF